MVAFVCLVLYDYKKIRIFLILDDKIRITFTAPFFGCVSKKFINGRIRRGLLFNDYFIFKLSKIVTHYIVSYNLVFAPFVNYC